MVMGNQNQQNVEVLVEEKEIGGRLNVVKHIVEIKGIKKLIKNNYFNSYGLSAYVDKPYLNIYVVCSSSIISLYTQLHLLKP